MILDEKILFIDADALAIDKPAGLPVDSPRKGGDSIEKRIAKGELHLGFLRSPVAMHRLDRDTSGCLLFARTPRGRKALQSAFEARRVAKTYRALLAGVPEGEGGTIDLPLGKVSTAGTGWRMVHDPAGQSAQSHWRLIATHEGQALVEFTPVTGRTHQIRVHAREGLGHAVVGDPVYGRRDEGPMLLHALRLTVPRDGRETIDVTAPLPDFWPDWAREA